VVGAVYKLEEGRRHSWFLALTQRVVWLLSFEVSSFSWLYLLGASVSANESGEKDQSGSNSKREKDHVETPKSFQFDACCCYCCWCAEDEDVP